MGGGTSIREREAKSDPGELLKARKARNEGEFWAKAGKLEGVKSRAEYLRRSSRTR